MTTPFHIHITPGDEAPIYRQIVRQVVEGVASGSLQPGARLASIRDLSRKLVVAPLTVKKGYDELEGQGVIETRRGQGTFVRADVGRSSEAATQRLRPLVRRLLLGADVGGIDEKKLISLLGEEREELRRERKEREENQ
ncbi:MAG: GntR family transcriptional regulator [Planctomycetes bacterium]|jgi:GntR family transcriptional regulator|nr:GntR family transcriptional regulator [Planctomycetota bacterium]